MPGYGFRPPYVWYLPKPVNDVDRIIDAFEVLAKNYEGKAWKKHQTDFSKKLEESVIKYGHGGSMGARNWFASFKYFGFAYVGKIDGRIHITDVGKEVLKNNKNARIRIVRGQLLKLQFPNPYQSRYVKQVELYPFRVLLKILLELPDHHISREELALFVLGLKKCEKDDVKKTVKKIIDYRKETSQNKILIKNNILKSYTKAVIEKFKKKGGDWKTVTKEKVWKIIYDYALRYFLTADYTELCKYNKKEGTLSLSENKDLFVRKLLKNKPLKVEHTYHNEEQWFYYYGSYKPEKRKREALSKKQRILYKMLSTAGDMRKAGEKINIRQLAEMYNISLKEVKKELISHGYISEIKEEREHGKILLMLARLCKKKGFYPHVAEGEQRIKKLKEISVSMDKNHFGIPDSVFKELRNVDLVWLNRDRIVKAFEVERGEVDREIHKFADIITEYHPPIALYLVVPDKNLKNARNRLNSPSYRKNKLNKKIKIITFSEVKKGKLKGC